MYLGTLKHPGKANTIRYNIQHSRKFILSVCRYWSSLQIILVINLNPNHPSPCYPSIWSSFFSIEHTKELVWAHQSSFLLGWSMIYCSCVRVKGYCITSLHALAYIWILKKNLKQVNKTEVYLLGVQNNVV